MPVNDKIAQFVVKICYLYEDKITLNPLHKNFNKNSKYKQVHRNCYIYVVFLFMFYLKKNT